MSELSSPSADSVPCREWVRGEYVLSTQRDRLDLGVIHGFLAQSYWASGRSRARVARSIAMSLPIGLYHQGEQVGFGRIVTDYVVIAFLADVFVLEAHRGRGLGLWLAETLCALPELSRVRRFLLGTRDAHGLYAKIGFSEPPAGILMGKLNQEADLEPASR
jgi:GNAT superfamily N-acetyltransferase